MTITSTVRRYCRCIYNIHKLKNSISANNDLWALFSDWVMQRGDGRSEASAGGGRDTSGGGATGGGRDTSGGGATGGGGELQKQDIYFVSVPMYSKAKPVACAILHSTGNNLSLCLPSQTTCAIHAYCEQYTNDVMT